MRLLVRFVWMSLVLWSGIAGSIGKAEEPRSHAPSSAVLASQQKGSSPEPLWHLDIRRNEPKKDFLGPRVVSDQKRVFYLQGGFVKAVSAKTGRQLWAFPVSRWAQLRYSSGWLLAFTYDSKVIALNAQTGKVDWQQTYHVPEGIETFKVQGDLLLVVVGERLIAYELATGRERWRVRGLYGLTQYPHHAVPSASGSVVFLELSYHSLTSSPDLFAFDRVTGKQLWKALSHFSPLEVIGDKVYSLRDDYPMSLDYPGRLRMSIFYLRSGKLFGERVYNASDSDWDSKVVVANAVYISDGGNITCFPLTSPGGKAKQNFVRVPQGKAKWLAEPQNGTFVLEWRGTLWLVRQDQKPCAPINLLKKGLELDKSNLARVDAAGNGLYLSLKNGRFYMVDTRIARVVFKLSLRSSTFGPAQVVGSTLIIQAENTLVAYPLPKILKP